MNPQLIVRLCLVLTSHAALRGGDFINLDFSHPDLTNLQYDQVRDAYYGAPSQVIPGWTIRQNQQPIDRVWVMEGGVLSPVTLGIFGQGTDSKWFLFRYAGFQRPGVTTSTEVSQTATIPEWALTLEFVWDGDKLLPSPLHVDGERVPITVLDGFDYTADISNWAGQQVTLSFEFPTGSSGYLTGLRFTVPEPHTWVLALAGGIGLYWLHRRASR